MSDKMLYVVGFCGECCIMATNAAEAEHVALGAVVDDRDGSGLRTWSPIRVTRLSDVDHDWLDSYPLGGDDKATVREIVGRMKR